jgi:putative inorganic carbon (HCO3(-)) transporter
LLGTDWLLKFPALDRVMSRLPGLIRGLPGVEEGLQPNYVAGALLLFLPVQLALLFGLPRRWGSVGLGLAALGLAGLTAGTLVLTQSRGGALGLACGLGLWLAWHGPRTRLLLLALLIAGAVAVVLIGPAEVAASLEGAAGRNLLESMLARVEVWVRALSAIQAFPLTGLGLNGFRHVMPVFFPLFVAPPTFDVSHAHNQFLQAALDLGLPGLVAFVALAVGAFGLLISARSQTGRRDRRLLAEGLAAALAAQLAFGLVDALAFGARAHVFFWVALAYIVCLYRLARAEPAAA